MIFKQLILQHNAYFGAKPVPLTWNFKRNNRRKVEHYTDKYEIAQKNDSSLDLKQYATI